MICAYDELYLPSSQRVLGDMYDFSVNTLNYKLCDFHYMFIGCGMAHQFEIGNPTYIAGMNGCDLARTVIRRCGLCEPAEEDVMYIDKSAEYWIGWALSYYQWKTGYKFSEINTCIPIEEMYNMYPTYHEMDIDALADALDHRTSMQREASRLKRLRTYINLSQSRLADISGVPLRQIQLFEQGQRDINKTQGETLKKLSRALQCNIEELLQ